MISFWQHSVDLSFRLFSFFFDVFFDFPGPWSCSGGILALLEASCVALDTNPKRGSTTEGAPKLSHQSRTPGFSMSPSLLAIRNFGVLEGSPGGLSDVSWGLLEHLLVVSWRVLGSWSPWRAHRPAQEQFQDGFQLSWSPYVMHAAFTIESKRFPNRVPEAARSQNHETTKLEHCTKDFNEL